MTSKQNQSAPSQPAVSSRQPTVSAPTGGIGCWFILRTGFVMIFLLLLNGLLVRAFFSANEELANEIRLAQALQFVLPVALIFIEYWVFDFFRGMGQR